MLSKEETKELKLTFWKGLKHYCAQKQVYRKWVLTGVKIRNTQLKFYCDRQCAMVLFQIDHKSDVHRLEVYNSFLAYRKLLTSMCGEDLQWTENFNIDNRNISAIFFLLPNINIYKKEDWEQIYCFFVEKMTILEDAYWEIKDFINEQLKGNLNA